MQMSIQTWTYIHTSAAGALGISRHIKKKEKKKEKKKKKGNNHEMKYINSYPSIGRVCLSTPHPPKGKPRGGEIEYQPCSRKISSFPSRSSPLLTSPHLSSPLLAPSLNPGILTPSPTTCGVYHVVGTGPEVSCAWQTYNVSRVVLQPATSSKRQDLTASTYSPPHQLNIC